MQVFVPVWGYVRTCWDAKNRFGLPEFSSPCGGMLGQGGSGLQLRLAAVFVPVWGYVETTNHVEYVDIPKDVFVPVWGYVETAIEHEKRKRLTFSSPCGGMLRQNDF